MLGIARSITAQSEELVQECRELFKAPALHVAETSQSRFKAGSHKVVVVLFCKRKSNLIHVMEVDSKSNVDYKLKTTSMCSVQYCPPTVHTHRKFIKDVCMTTHQNTVGYWYICN